MNLRYCPDFDNIKTRWDHYWNHEVLGRPLLTACLRGKNHPYGERRYYNAVNRNWDPQLRFIDAMLEDSVYLGEAVPFFDADLGPDQFASFFGGEFRFAESSIGTDWVEPIVTDWARFIEEPFNPENRNFRTLLGYAETLRKHGKDRYLVGMIDLHSNMDCLSALRGAQNLCLDIYDCPELVEQALAKVRKLYKTIYGAYYEAAGMNSETGSVGWLPFWTRGKFAVLQCDSIVLFSPEVSRKLIIPALEEEAEFLDHCVYHLDGPGELPHLDDILSIKKIDAVQWVAGAGKPEMWQWTDVLKRIRKAGKGLIIQGIPDIGVIRKVHQELGPEGMVYEFTPRKVGEFEEISGWLERNT